MKSNLIKKYEIDVNSWNEATKDISISCQGMLINMINWMAGEVGSVKKYDSNEMAKKFAESQLTTNEDYLNAIRLSGKEVKFYFDVSGDTPKLVFVKQEHKNA